MKTIALILSVIMVSVCILTGCTDGNAEKENDIPIIAELIRAGSDGALSELEDPNQHSGYFKDETAKSEMTVTFLGEEYKGTYISSSKLTADSLEQRDHYDNFTVDRNSGEILDIRTTHSPCHTYFEGGEAPYTVADCRKIADELAKKYLENFSDFSVTETPHKAGVSYIYSRYIEGVKTGEHFAVIVCQYHGKINSMNMGNHHMFEGDDLKSRSSEVKALKEASRELIEEKIKSEFATEKYYDGWEIKYEELIKLQDGGYGILYNVSVKHREPMEDGTFAVGGELVRVMVKFDK